jgi:ABC-type phosphate/phosphonate transport system substrate-binding protein
MLIGLPMYAFPELSRATHDWRAGLLHHFQRAGFDKAAEALEEPQDLYAHWRQPELLFTQTCGYPLTHDLAGQVQLVATPCYDAAGCQGPSYRSFVVIRDDGKIEHLEDLRGKRVAFNSRDSQSGYNTLRHLIAPLARDGHFFDAALETGGHRKSLGAVRENLADVAAIDCVSYALIAAIAPTELSGIRVLCETAPAPCLPYITAGAAPADIVARLRDGLHAAIEDPDLAAARAELLIAGIAVLPAEAYDAILAMEQAAIASGYKDLG